MRIYYGGSEVGGWRKLLADENITYVSLSYMGLRRKTKFTKPWIINERYSETTKVFLDSGAYTINNDPDKFTNEELLEIASAYMAFAYDNLDRIDMVSEFDALQLGDTWIKAAREDFWDDLGDKFMPIWHAESGLEELEQLASTYHRVGVTKASLGDRDLSPKLNQLVARYGVLLHGVAMTKTETMRDIKWNSVSSTSWLNPSKYGETMVWTQQGFNWYPKKYKDQQRQRLRTWFTSNGFDSQKITDDNTTELLRLSLWSWEKLVDDINRKAATYSPALVTNLPETPNLDNMEIISTEVDNPQSEMRNNELIPRMPEYRETTPLPIIGFGSQVTKATGPDGEEIENETRLVEMRSDSMRMCGTCVLSSKCPAFKIGANCAYNIPIEVKTQDQMQALQDSLIEMQTQRVLFMKMSEDLEGGYVDTNLSNEIDRLQKLIKAKRDAEQDGFSLTITAKQKGEAGMISRLFGNESGEKLRQLDQPKMADEILVDRILDAEVIEERNE